MKLERQLIITEDGSHSIYMPELQENYHSIHGAVQESNHVFIKNGLQEILKSRDDVRILEMGFGTGLNAFLTLTEAEKRNIPIQYTAIEAFPLELEIISQLNYSTLPGYEESSNYFQKLHKAEWNTEEEISPFFRFKKLNISLEEFSSDQVFDLIYFDAFAPEVQPELWTEEIFKKIHDLMSPEGILVTYCCKGLVKRNMKAAGLSIEKLPGPPGKREMLRARR